MRIKTKTEMQKYFSYCPETGTLKRIDRKNGSGSIDAYGYLILKVKGVQYKAHRVAWLLYYGEWPNGVTDHINGVKTDNRISNLRDVSQGENCKNLTIKTNIETGVKGVFIDRTNGLKKKFSTKVKGKTFRFYSLDEAKTFRKNKIREMGYGAGHG